MGQIGIWQIVIVAVVVVLLFGRGKIPELMGDVAKGINSFKKGLTGEEKDKDAEQIENQPAEKVSAEDKQKDKVS
ncbi:sec-independent protein translocase protein TatA [Cohaesibacter sp. ES.047]|uniref:twin-arginine translocase TatA/TatE family subunit n=1 Tax=Cohaesibacter sp. ES.047 TaxID=1798205 RepID=UPI000BB98F8B|nr:twin-arginine translocase TatA/TatE family subunit [Cohaesibacter sp. ES.047]SNY93646.1 sec-independent protein translocase protein TatA [Cohaesibacter sp. ES.047]